MTDEEIAKLEKDYAAVLLANAQVARIYADAVERISELESALKPFGDAYKLHRNFANEPKKFKARIALSLGMMDWDRIASVLKIEPQEENQIMEVLS